jgi:hypothetical protein
MQNAKLRGLMKYSFINVKLHRELCLLLRQPPDRRRSNLFGMLPLTVNSSP